MYISPHFSYNEVIKSKTALDLGMDNSLPPEFLPNVQQLADMLLEHVREHFNKSAPPKRIIKINSWYRCPALNQMISNNPNSQHTKGEAVDFTVPGIPNFTVAEYIRDNLVYDQLILERSWIHCSFVSEGNRMDVLRTDDGRTYQKGLV
jgi:zinc D-Ala-D-Ala carboxypeptidase